MFKILKNLLLYAGLTKKEFNGISEDITEANRKALKIFSAIAGTFLLILFSMSFVSESMAMNRWIYFSALLVSVVIYVVAIIKTDNFKYVRASFLTTAGLYAFMSIIIIFGMFLSFEHPDEATTSFITLLMVIPLLFYDRPLRVGVFLIVICAFFLLEVGRIKSPEVVFTDTVNTIIFGLLSCVVNTSMLAVKMKRLALEKRTIMLAETDVLTGLKNRNCYETRLEDYPKEAKTNVVCVYADVNGLHELNNTKGHEAGDTMLKFIAKQLQTEFGMRDAYRVGGDEYVAMAKDRNLEEVNNAVEAINEAVLKEGYHCSFGTASAEVAGINMLALIKKAEAHMYDAKREYYSHGNVDRRHRC